MATKIKFSLVLLMFLILLSLHIKCYFVTVPSWIVVIAFPCMFISFGMWLLDINIDARRRIKCEKKQLKPFDINNMQLQMLSEAKTWQVVFIIVVGLYVFINFFFSMGILEKGAPEIKNNNYYQNNHGVYTEISYDAYSRAILAQTKAFTGLVGLPLAYYGELVRKKHYDKGNKKLI